MRLGVALLGAALLAGCGSAPVVVEAPPDSGFRHPGARADRTIFSPLDLPTPGTVRNASGAPGAEYWQQQADYQIEAALDPVSRVVKGRARIRYLNNSPDALDYVWLHLEQNLFRADSLGETLRRNAARAPRAGGGARPEGPGTDGAVIRGLRGAGGAPLPYVVHDTLARIDLPAPLAGSGGELVFEIDWEFSVPERVFRRFGSEKVEQGEIFELAQWFPAVAVYDDVHGWNTLPYLGSGEFYTNFGDYDVRLTVPRNHLLVATGVLQNESEVFTPEQVERLTRARTSAETVLICSAEEVGTPASRPAGEGPLTWHFLAEDVRTFAFASSEAFILDAAGLTLQPVPGVLDSPRQVLIQSAYPKEALPLWASSTQMLLKATRGYSERWYPYPYPVATNVNGPEGGMEYPMIIFCGERKNEEGLYSVTTHEIGHNWFPMLVSTDERRHAWMDEGFNTFINYYSHADWFPGKTPSRGNPALFAPTMLQDDLLPVDTPPDRLPRGLIGQLQYTKTGAGLVLLREQILGPERFDHAFRTYIRRWAYKAPRPADFYRTMEDAAGADLSWFWTGWFRETGYLDQAVAEVVQAPVVPAAAAPGAEPAGQAVIRFVNQGELVMPLVYRVVFADGTQQDVRLPVEMWASSNRFAAGVTTRQAIVSVVIDPEQRFPDVERSNNAWQQPAPAAR
ncbi:MAG: M1 family metallopeptidase [Planctomycetota bacterium]